MTTYWYGRPGTSAMRTAADLAVDYQSGHDFTGGGLPDTAGDGQWVYLSSSDANPSATRAQTAPLVYGDVGGAGHQGYGGGENGHNLAAISDQYLFADGDVNIGVQGEPGYHELALHPAGMVWSGGFEGDADMPFAVARLDRRRDVRGLGQRERLGAQFRQQQRQRRFPHLRRWRARVLRRGDHYGTMPEAYFDFDVKLDEGSVVRLRPGQRRSGQPLRRRVVAARHHPGAGNAEAAPPHPRRRHRRRQGRRRKTRHVGRTTGARAAIGRRRFQRRQRGQRGRRVDPGGQLGPGFQRVRRRRPRTVHGRTPAGAGHFDATGPRESSAGTSGLGIRTAQPHGTLNLRTFEPSTFLRHLVFDIRHSRVPPTACPPADWLPRRPTRRTAGSGSAWPRRPGTLRGFRAVPGIGAAAHSSVRRASVPSRSFAVGPWAGSWAANSARHTRWFEPAWRSGCVRVATGCRD